MPKFARLAFSIKFTSLTLAFMHLSCAMVTQISIDNPTRVPFSGFKTTAAKTPEREHSLPFLEHPEGSPVRLELLQTGQLMVPVKGMLNPEDPMTQELLKQGRFMEVEVFVHWIQHRTVGDVLIDTGLDASFRNGPGNIHGLFAGDYIHSSKLGIGDSIGEQIAARHIHPLAVLYTHLHGDHTAGTPELDKSIRFIAGKHEVYHNIPLLYWSEHLKGVRQLEEIDPSQCPVYPILGQACDVFDDGSVFALATPGHSEGHLAYFVFSRTGPVLITGDASHTRFGFENGIEPGWADDRDQAKASLRRLKDLVQKIPSTKVIFGHKI